MAVDIEFLSNNSQVNITNNFGRVKTALQDAVGRSGNTPNEMKADLDLNGNDILNVESIDAATLTVDGQVVQVNIDTFEPAINSVTTPKIRDKNVTLEKLSDGVLTAINGGLVVKDTLAILNTVVPDSENDGGWVLDDPTPINNGYYSRVAGVWTFGRNFPDTFAKVILSGDGTTQTGAISPGVNPASTEVFFAKVITPNIGPLTLSVNGEVARPIVNLAGNLLTAGEWTGMVMFYLNDVGQYQLLIDAGAALASAQSASDSEASAERAEGFAAMLSVDKVKFKTVMFLLSDNSMVYAAAPGKILVAAGDIVEAQGFRYEVAASGAVDYHLSTAGGVHLYLLANESGEVNVLAGGVVGNGVDDDTARFQAVLDTGMDVRVPRDVTLRYGSVTMGAQRLCGAGTLIKTSQYGLVIGDDDALVDGLNFAGEAHTGSGRDTEVKISDGASSPKITNCFFTTTDTVYHAVMAADDPGDVNETSVDAPYAESVRRLDISSNNFLGNYARPVHLVCVDGFKIIGNYFTGCRFDAVRIREYIGEGIISQNHFYEVGDQTWPDDQTRDCIDTAFSGDRLVITDNIMIRPAHTGIDIKGIDIYGVGRASGNIIMSGNYIEGARYPGISIDESAVSDPDFIWGFSVIGNQVISCNQNNNPAARLERGLGGTGSVGVYGIQAQKLARYNDISHNIIIGCWGRGLGVTDTAGATQAVRSTIVSNNLAFNNTGVGIYLDGVKYVQVTGNQSGNDNTAYTVSPHTGDILPQSDGQDYGYAFTSTTGFNEYSLIFTENIAVDNIAAPVLFTGSGTYADIFAKYADNQYFGTGADMSTSGNRTRWAQAGRRIFWGNGIPPNVSEGTFQQGDIIYNTTPTAGNFIGVVCTTGGNPGTWKTFGAITV